jgi:hypothetical protein
MLACFLRWASLLSAAAGLIAGASLQHAKAAGEPSTPPLDARIGWVDSCLAIQNDGLQPGTPVTVMLFDTDERLVAQRVLTRRVGAKILAKTTSAAKCPALIEDRRVSNQIAGVSFYTVSLDGAPAARPSYGIFGIGVVGVRPTDQIDLDGNGAAESFTVCKSFEALNFAVWKGRPREGVPLWAGQYYTGQQDEEKDCVPVLEQDATEPAQLPFAAQIGWIDECLAIKNGTLAPGTPVTVFMLDGNENATGERILKRRRRKDSREDALGAEMPRAEREQRQRGGRCVLLYACPREGRRPGQFGSGDLRDRSSRSRGYESGAHRSRRQWRDGQFYRVPVLRRHPFHCLARRTPRR